MNSLSSSVLLGRYTLRNRLAMAPMTRKGYTDYPTLADT